MSKFAMACGLIATLVTVTLSARDKLNCEKQATRSDACLANALLIGESKVIIPHDMDELEKHHCSRIRREYKCIAAYKPCLSGAPRIMFNMIARNFHKEVVTRQCGTLEGRQEFVVHFKCFDEDSIATLHQIVNKLTLAIEMVKAKATVEQSLPAVCCGYHLIVDVGKDILDTLCLDKTGPETSKYVMGLIQTILKEVIDLGCGGHETLRQCDKNLPQFMAQFRNITSLESVGHMDHTPMMPLLEVVGRLHSL